MKITRLQTENFRNLPDLDLDLNREMVVLVGANASGKTNFLESVYYASTLQAFPGRKSWELIRFGQDYFRLIAETGEQKLEFYYGKKDEKKYLRSQSIDGARKKSSEMFGLIPAVSFLPQDMNLLILGPSLRRDFLDEILLQSEPEYEALNLEYGKIISQRNELLGRVSSGTAKIEELEFWDEELAKAAFQIISLRQNLIDKLNENLEKVYREMTGSELEFRINYLSPLAGKENSQDKLLELIRQKHKVDIATEQTSVGPHRDDWKVENLQGQSLATLLSRGEQRSVIVSLKIQEWNFLRTSLGRDPLILLDELLAELDQTRQTNMLKNLPQQAQKFLTATSLNDIPKSLLEGALVIELGADSQK